MRSEKEEGEWGYFWGFMVYNDGDLTEEAPFMSFRETNGRCRGMVTQGLRKGILQE